MELSLRSQSANAIHVATVGALQERGRSFRMVSWTAIAACAEFPPVLCHFLRLIPFSNHKGQRLSGDDIIAWILIIGAA